MANGKVMGVVKGVAFGMASGAVVGYVGKKMMDEGSRSMRKKLNKAVDTMENIATTAKYIFK